MRLSLGFSPCPNDTFIFDALVNKLIDTEGLEFDVFMEDIETLNHWGNEGKLDITKLSFPAFFPNLRQYIALPSGGALGKGVGPLLVAKNEGFFKNFKEITDYKALKDFEIAKECKIATPGQYTTASFLFSELFPQIKNERIPMLFSEIEGRVLSTESDLGLLIHENRFTYAEKGLIKLADLGKLWEQKTKFPTPLACIAIKNSIEKNVQRVVGNLIKKSIEYSFANYPAISSFVKHHAQTMNEEIMRQHIELYVNNFSISLGNDGENAINLFYSIYKEDNNTVIDHNLFLH